MRDVLQKLVSPVILSAILLFAVAFNVTLPDMGETYVSRNLFAWAVIFPLIAYLWWQPITTGNIHWSPFWLIGLFVPVIGFVLLMAVNILGGYEHYHMGHYLFPFMLLAFALLILGLLQYEWNENTKFALILTALICFMPQYLIHLLTSNAVIFSLMPFDEMAIPRILYKPYAGFGQYNVYGSTHATLLVLAGAAFVFANVSKKARIALMVPVGLLAIDLPFTRSSTALLGLVLGLGLLGAHVFFVARQAHNIRQYLIFIAYLAVISLLVTGGLALVEGMDGNQEFTAEKASFSINTRVTMWIVGFWGFVDAPLFGHGLGSYLSIYMREFGEYGLASGLIFYPNVTVPHNLIIHVLSETGLFGFALLLGPFIYIAVNILRKVENRILVLASLAPILIHTQLEYPYIASGLHYWLFAVAFVFALGGQLQPSRQLVYSTEKTNAHFLVFGSVSVAALVGVYMSISLAFAAQNGAKTYAKTMAMTADEFIETRFTMADVQHPILGHRFRAVAHLTLINKAITERRGDILRNISAPMLENEIVPKFPTIGVWDAAMRVYVILGDRDRAMRLISYVNKYDPEKASSYENMVRDRLRLTPPTPRPE